jgi:hypothetical protein
MKKFFVVFMAIMMIAIMGCKDESAIYGNGTSAPYEISHYIDTISGQLILTTVCNSNDNGELSVSTLSLGKVDSTKWGR